MGNSFDKLKNSTAEAAMKAAGKEMMEKARLKREAEEASKPKQLGKWEITLKSSTEYAKVDIENFITKLMEFETTSNTDFPMLRVHVDQVVEETK